jgi:quercetin dioxygenase-like cupin family protein
MPIEIRRFGVGHRRPDGPPGTSGVTGQVITADERGLLAELAFGRGARMEPHANPNTSWLVVIEGGGWVGVGDERTRIAAGEAVLLPPDVPHAAWTEHSQMRAFMIEFTPAGPAVSPLLIGTASPVDPERLDPGRTGIGALREDAARRAPGEPDAGEPA